MEKQEIRKELNELIATYHEGSFAQLVCNHVHAAGMTPEEVEELLEAMKEVISCDK